MRREKLTQSHHTFSIVLPAFCVYDSIVIPIRSIILCCASLLFSRLQILFTNKTVHKLDGNACERKIAPPKITFIFQPFADLSSFLIHKHWTIYDLSADKSLIGHGRKSITAARSHWPFHLWLGACSQHIITKHIIFYDIALYCFIWLEMVRVCEHLFGSVFSSYRHRIHPVFRCVKSIIVVL